MSETFAAQILNVPAFLSASPLIWSGPSYCHLTGFSYTLQCNPEISAEDKNLLSV